MIVNTQETMAIRVMMIVAFYPYPIIGGLEHQAHELSKKLMSLDVNVQVVSGKFDSLSPDNETVDGVPVCRISLSEIRLLRFIQTPIWFFWAMYSRRNTFDIVHVHQLSWFGLFAILIGKILGKPVITKLPNVGFKGIPGLVNSGFGKLRLLILKLSDSIVAMSDASVSELEHVNFSSNRILRVANGISLKECTSKSRSEHVTKQCNVVFVGRLVPQKGVSDLFIAWQRIAKVHKNVSLEIWGDGPLRENLELLCQSLGIKDSVNFAGNVANVREKLVAMDIFVLPSYVEGNSNAILEAMSAGLPIVATRVGGAEMQVGKQGRAFLFEPADTDGLCRALDTLITNSHLRGEVGEAMRKRIAENFDISSVARCYINGYIYLISDKKDEIYNASII